MCKDNNKRMKQEVRIESACDGRGWFYKIDIQDTELESIFQKEGPDYVSHHAAQKDVCISVHAPIYDAKINILLGILNVLQNCVKHRVKKIVFTSTGGPFTENRILSRPRKLVLPDRLVHTG